MADKLRENIPDEFGALYAQLKLKNIWVLTPKIGTNTALKYPSSRAASIIISPDKT